MMFTTNDYNNTSNITLNEESFQHDTQENNNLKISILLKECRNEMSIIKNELNDMQQALNTCRSNLLSMAPMLITTSNASKKRATKKRLSKNSTSTKTYYPALSSDYHYQTYTRKYKPCKSSIRVRALNKMTPEQVRNNLKKSFVINDLQEDTDRIYCSITQLGNPNETQCDDYLTPDTSIMHIPLRFQPKFSSTPLIKQMLATSTPKILNFDRKCSAACCKSIQYDFEEYNVPLIIDSNEQHFYEIPKVTYYNIQSMNPITSTPYKLYTSSESKQRYGTTTSTSTLTTVVNCCIKPLRRLINKKIAKKKLQMANRV